MNNLETMKSLGLAALVAVLNAGVAYAQDASKPHAELPSGPVLSPAPSYSEWVVTFSYPDERTPKSTALGASPSSTRTKSITTTKTDDIVHEEIVDNQGKKIELWHVGSTQYRKASGSPMWSEQNVSNGSSGYAPMPNSGFRDLEWVTKANYISKSKLGDKECLVFAPNAPSGWSLSGPDSLDALGEVALIDLESRLPLQAQMGGVVRFYHFNPPPTDKLTLPDDLKQQLKAGAEARARLAQPAGRPY